jgi:rhamnulokinase
MAPVHDKDALQWAIPQLCQEILAALRGIAGHEEPVESISCHSWAAGCLLFAADGSLITPAYHHWDTERAQRGAAATNAEISAEALYAETGVQEPNGTTLVQLAAESSRRLEHTAHFLPVADAFNYLLAGLARSELSLASLTQLYNPVKRAWSAQILSALNLPARIFPRVVASGAELGRLKPEIIKETGLNETRVVAACSSDIASALAGLPSKDDEVWAFARLGATTLIGAETAEPILTDAARQLGFTNQIGCGGAFLFHKATAGLWVLDECKRFWKERDRELDDSVLRHLTISAPALESIVDFNDPRFSAPGDMPLKIQEYCKETNQEIPRKPGPVIRCVLESLALQARGALLETACLSGRQFNRLYLMGGQIDPLLTHFTANALQVPAVVLLPEAAAIGNVVIQALALGHLRSFAEAREIVRQSFRTETITPRTNVWDAAHERLASYAQR